MVSLLKRALKKAKWLMRRPVVMRPLYVSSESLLAGRCILVLGGSGGIGSAIANALKASGATVVVASRNPSYELSAGQYEVVTWDVSDIANIETRFRNLVSEYSIDSVVNCQGVNLDIDYAGDFFAVTPDAWENTFVTNAESVFFVCQAASRYFMERKIHGHILNIASTEGLKGGYYPYSISKSAVVSLTKGIGKFMARRDVTVNGIAPGSTATKMIGVDPCGDLSCNYLASGRRSLPEEIANAAVFLMSDMGDQMCGQILVVDGGQSLL